MNPTQSEPVLFSYRNIKKHTFYSDNFILYVVDMSQMNLTAKSDKQFRLNAGKQIQDCFHDQEAYYDDICSYRRAIEEQDAIIKEQNHTIRQQIHTISQQEKEIEDLQHKINELKSMMNSA